MLEIYEVLKADNDNRVVIIKKGDIYYAILKDAYVLNGLLDFEMDDKCCTFKNIKEVTSLLKKENIGYIIYEGKILDIGYGESENYYRNNYYGTMKEYY